MGARLTGSGAARSLPSSETASLFLLNTISKLSPPRTIARPTRSAEGFSTGRPLGPAGRLQKPDKQLSPGQHPSTNFLPLARNFFFHVISRDLSLTLVHRSYELRHALVMEQGHKPDRFLPPFPRPHRSNPPIARRPNSAPLPMSAGTCLICHPCFATFAQPEFPPTMRRNQAA